MSKRLTQKDWIAAGFRALTRQGHIALKAEVIARELGATKGSFYWHFADVKAFHAAMLDLWEEEATAGIVATVASVPPGPERLARLVAATRDTPEEYGGIGAEAAIRAWARVAPDVAARLAEVDARRVAFLVEDFRASVHSETDAQDRARLFYAAHLGCEQMALTLGGGGQKELELLIERLLPVVSASDLETGR